VLAVVVMLAEGCPLIVNASTLLLVTAARPAYAGTEGCYILRMFFFFFLLNESP